MDRQMLYWQLTMPEYEEGKKRLIHALEILENVLAADPLADKKRNEFAGKFRDDDEQADVAAELKELVFLSQHTSNIVYAPTYPDKKGPDFRCDPVSRPIEVEVTNLSGTEGERKSKGLRYQLDKQLYDVPSGCRISIGVLSIRTQEDLTSTFRSIKEWLEKQPKEGEYDLPNGLRIRVWRTNFDPEHTLVHSHGWRGSGVQDRDEQILRKVRRKAGQLSGLCPGLIVTDVELEYNTSFADTIHSKSGQSVFRLHPQISALILVSDVKGMHPRTLFPNPRASHPLEKDEIDRLI